MADRTYTYAVKIDTAAARAQAVQLRAVFERELKSISAADLKLINPQAIQQAQQSIAQVTQAQKQAGQVAVEQERQATQAARAASGERTQAARAESVERQNAARAAAVAAIEEEKRLTAQTKAEIAERQRSAQQQTKAPKTPAPSGLGSLLSGDLTGALKVGGAAVAGFITVQTIQRLEAYARSSAQLDTQIRRTNLAFNTLAGGVANAEGRLLAIQQASGGTIDRMNAIGIANQAAALKLAATSEEFGRLTQAARVTSLISPVIHDVSTAISELGLASANLSFRRLDQLGLSVTEVKTKMKELQAANSSLSDSEAFLKASVDSLIAKGGGIINSTEAQASGVEKLNVAWSEFMNQESGISAAFDSIYAAAARAVDLVATKIGFGSPRAIKAALDEQVKALQAQLDSNTNNVSVAGFGQLPANVAPDFSQKENVEGFKQLQAAINAANDGLEAGTPGALTYKNILLEVAETSLRTGIVTKDQTAAIVAAGNAFQRAAKQANGFGTAEDRGLSDRKDRQQSIINRDDLASIDEAIAKLKEMKAAGSEAAGGSIDGLAALRSELIQTGQLSEASAAKLQFLKAAATGAGDSNAFLAKANQELGSTFVANNAEIQSTITDMFNLEASMRAGTTQGLAYAAELGEIKKRYEELKAQAQIDFNTGFTGANSGLAEVNKLIEAGVPGLEHYRDTYKELQAQIIEQGGPTQEQLTALGNTKAGVQAVINVQDRYADNLRGLGNTFLTTNEDAAKLIEQMAQVQVAVDNHSKTAAEGIVETQQLGAEFEALVAKTQQVSTEGLDQLAGSISQFDEAVASGLPGADAWLSQALSLQEAITTTGIVSEEQAAQLESLAIASESAIASAAALNDIEAALGSEIVATDGGVAALVGSITQLDAAHNAGAISTDVFAGAMSVLIARLYELLTAAGATKAEVDALIGSLGALPSGVKINVGSAGFQQGQALGASADARAGALAAAKQRREQEAAARKAAAAAERGAKRAASEFEKGIKKAAQEFESALKSVPGLFGRSQVTEGQLKLAAGGVPQNFADDFLRRLEDEIKNGKDWPDVSIEKAKEALARVGIAASDNAEILFQQISDAWESGLLFSDKANLELINAEAVKASLELQEKAKQGQQNIMDYFKNVMGIAIDAATGGQVDGATGGATVKAKDATGAIVDVPDEIELVPSAAIADQFVNGTLTISSIALSATAQASLDGLLASSAISLRVVDIALTPEALTPLQSLTATISTIAFSAEAQAQLATLNQPQLQQGVDNVGKGASTFVFPDVGLQFVEALGAQLQAQEQKFLGQGAGIVQIVAQGMTGFDFSFLATAMISGIRTGFERDEIRAAFRGIGAMAVDEISIGLSEHADSIPWASIFLDAVQTSMTEDFANALVEGTTATQ